jgi:uncharacterized RDD family membrane protein YckC
MGLLDEHLNIDTPENVTFGYAVAGIGSRFLAALVDTLIIIIIQIVVQLTLFAVLNTAVNLSLDSDARTLAWAAAIFGLVGFFLLWGYYIFFELAWNGQSPGKRWVGLRVIRTDGTPITLSETVIRNLVRLVDFLPLAYGVGVVSMFIDPRSRRLGDLAAGTLVVRDRGTVTLSSLGSDPHSVEWGVPASTLEALQALPLKRLSDQDLQMAEDFLRRRDELANSDALAAQILRLLLSKMDAAPDILGNHRTDDLLAGILRLSRRWE